MVREQLVAELAELMNDVGSVDAALAIVRFFLVEGERKVTAQSEQNLQSGAGVCEFSNHDISPGDVAPDGPDVRGLRR